LAADTVKYKGKGKRESVFQKETGGKKKGRYDGEGRFSFQTEEKNSRITRGNEKRGIESTSNKKEKKKKKGTMNREDEGKFTVHPPWRNKRLGGNA